MLVVNDPSKKKITEKTISILEYFLLLVSET